MGGDWMSDKKHTAGPWKWDGGGYIDAPRECIAGINATGSPSESEANARLIAAAPELLEACEAARTVWEQGCVDRGWKDHRNWIDDAKDLIDDAIAKATGG
jgi:hypothetical protein